MNEQIIVCKKFGIFAVTFKGRTICLNETFAASLQGAFAAWNALDLVGVSSSVRMASSVGGDFDKHNALMPAAVHVYSKEYLTLVNDPIEAHEYN